MKLFSTKTWCAAICCTTISCVMLSTPASAQNAGASATTDQAFVNLAAQTDMTEANLGQQAANKAAAQDVKDFAQMVVTDHTNDYNTLTAVAKKAGLTVPTGLDAQHEKMAAQFEKLNGKAFDRLYAKDMVAGHEAAIAAYDKESRAGQNADVKAYAQGDIATLEKHKAAAHKLK